ncbi:Major facilitator superfamily domain general substrate transporter [Penicillium expansum]|nr:Major facilitator superfamily domain general substrate transporter [Penicillium expansum]
MVDDIPATKELSHDPAVEGFSHHANDIASDREPYGPPGLRGLAANPFVVLCAACSTLGGLLFGYDQGVVSVILVMDQFLTEFPRIDEGNPGSGFAKGLLTAMIELGALIGALNQGWIADKISRRYSILVAVAIFTLGSVLQTAAYGYPMLTVARLIGGVGIGMLSMVAPLYISEISPPECRGTLLVLEEWCIVLGIVIAFWITYGTRYMVGEWAWRLPFLLQLIPGFVLAAGVYALPFSPRWLASKGRDEEALDSLCRLRSLPASDRRVRQELMDIQAEVRFHQQMNRENHPDLQGGGTKNSILQELSSWADCFRKGCWRRTHIGIGLGFFQQFIGINALIYYSPTLFATMGLDTSMQLIMSGVLNVVQLVGVTTSIWTMDVVGRRKLLLGGAALMAISHIIIAALVGIYSVDWPSHKAEGWTSVAFLLFYMLAFGATWGPIPWAMPSEIFPSSLRAKGVALSTCSNWLNNFIIGLITPPLVQDTGYETKGRTLEQMDHVFKDNSSEEEKAKRRVIEAELIRAQYENVHQEFA